MSTSAIIQFFPMNNPKPYAPAAQRNQQAILSVLRNVLVADDTVFEIGSGTGQHACHIASAMPGVTWQTSDLDDKLPGIQRWIADSGCTNILSPTVFDLNDAVAPEIKVSVCFSANTLHIISWDLVVKLFNVTASMLEDNGKLVVYGPFAFDRRHVSASNIQFDRQLRNGNSDSGIRDVSDLQVLASANGYSKATVYNMPANNHLLVWRRDIG